MYKYLLTIFILFFSTKTYAFEDYIISTKGKLTDISIEDNTVVNVCPLVTTMNDKNILMVTPLKKGKTRFCVLKNGKQIKMFHIEIEDNKTKINDVEGFEILSLDYPKDNEETLILDEPPMLKEDI